MGVSRGQKYANALSGVQGGYAPLDSGLLIPLTYVPSKAVVGRTIQKITRTSGSFTLAISTTTAAEINSAMRLTLAASTGDVLLIGLSAMVSASNGDVGIDSATIVSGSIKHQVSGGTRPFGHMYNGITTAGQIIGAGATLPYVVASDDISGGNVTVSLTFINSSGSNTATLFATSQYGLTYWVVNTGQ